ncbi:MAG: glutaminyl-peptide cyclotransferase [Gammaproteobacteria bacterium]|nr:MAG: glutaminyl-peptide cyclotransferase [Gammaproteobacteria bacterium]RKZ44282.1 MAG: glutaminyl-peptide cyclotransferase [Gammaproteobacteria bacterium]RKZ74587.1 MAG: glutaminyl-peptide cyclotransferase [Gammaproteobacteria bacterium]
MHKKTLILISSLLLISPIIILFWDNVAQGQTPRYYHYRVINTYPHDHKAFTQGLIYHDGVLYESTGKWGQSSLRQVDLKTGEILQIYHLPRRYFAEGMTIWQNKIIQLTWRSKIGFVYNLKNFEPLTHFTYPTEGWGMTNDGEKLIMSDGTDKLYFLNVKTFETIGFIQVRDQNIPITKLNELEYIEGEIFANVWKSDLIARISPQTGQVLGWIDLNGLKSLLPKTTHPKPNVLNGIAYDKIGQRLFVTGKFWSQLFEIQLVPVR